MAGKRRCWRRRRDSNPHQPFLRSLSLKSQQNSIMRHSEHVDLLTAYLSCRAWIYKRGAKWWIGRRSHDGRLVQKPLKTNKKTDAESELARPGLIEQAHAAGACGCARLGFGARPVAAPAGINRRAKATARFQRSLVVRQPHPPARLMRMAMYGLPGSGMERPFASAKKESSFCFNVNPPGTGVAVMFHVSRTSAVNFIPSAI